MCQLNYFSGGGSLCVTDRDRYWPELDGIHMWPLEDHFKIVFSQPRRHGFRKQTIIKTMSIHRLSFHTNLNRRRFINSEKIKNKKKPSTPAPALAVVIAGMFRFLPRCLIPDWRSRSRCWRCRDSPDSSPPPCCSCPGSSPRSPPAPGRGWPWC